MSLLVHSYLVKNPVEFPQILSQAKATAASANAELYLLFVGTKSTSTGKSWCGDCVRAEPVLEDALAKHNQSFVLVSCDVDREPYRTPQKLKEEVTDSMGLSRCVPSLLKVEGDHCVARLNDSECQNADVVKAFLKGTH
eukprot:scaffold1818_cov214-Ochromonas_danica.AAC.3